MVMGPIVSTPCATISKIPFAGSSTTGHAALLLGRRYIGLELSPAYAAVSRERLSRVTGELPASRYGRARQQSLGLPDAPPSPTADVADPATEPAQ
jgi:DNA methylase